MVGHVYHFRDLISKQSSKELVEKQNSNLFMKPPGPDMNRFMKIASPSGQDIFFFAGKNNILTSQVCSEKDLRILAIMNKVMAVSNEVIQKYAKGKRYALFLANELQVVAATLRDACINDIMMEVGCYKQTTKEMATN